jgi:SnoaL-like protein
VIEMTELKQVMLGFYRALSGGDADSLEELISPQSGVLGIGTDPDEWWQGPTKLRSIMKTQMAEMGGSITIVGSDPIAYSEGTVGWVADRPRFRLDDGTESPIRLTATFHKEQGAWKIVQFHVSVGVPNEDVVGKELTV